MKYNYEAPTTEVIAFDNEELMERAQSWTDPDGNHHDIKPGNPDDEAKKNIWDDDDDFSDWDSFK